MRYPAFERLETRALLSAYTSTSVDDLIADINAANQEGGSNTITLVAGTTFTLTAVNITTNGPTGLPAIAANNDLTIRGNGGTIERSAIAGTPAFRLFDVAAGASLHLENLTLQGGIAFGSPANSPQTPARGGAIYNQGALSLSGVTVQNNTALGRTERVVNGFAAGGGIFSSGALTVTASTIRSNQAVGGFGIIGSIVGRRFMIAAGGASGGGLYVQSGSAALNGVTISSNTARGGNGSVGIAPLSRGDPRAGSDGSTGGAGGAGYGGGLYVDAGMVSLVNSTLSFNTAQGGNGGNGGSAKAGTRGDGGSGGRGGAGNGGGLFAAGSVVLRNDLITDNAALGGAGGLGGAGKPRGANGSAGLGSGGGIYIATGGSVCVDAFTFSNVVRNRASTRDPNIAVAGIA
jgi:hypothetical protein